MFIKIKTDEMSPLNVTYIFSKCIESQVLYMQPNSQGFQRRLSVNCTEMCDKFNPT